MTGQKYRNRRIFQTGNQEQKIEALGPLGNGFPLEEAEGEKVFLIGGGIGIPPMLETAKQLKLEKTAVLGYRDELFLNDEFTRYADDLMLLQKMEAHGTKGNVLNAICERGLEAEVNFCLWSNADASCTERVCSREEYHMLDFHGGKNGVWNRSMSWMCLQIKRD